MKINWKLYNNKKLIINDIGVPALWDNSKVIHEDKYGKHTVDIKHKVYNRINNDNEVIVDFSNNLFIVKFDTQELKFDIETRYKETKDEIRLWYSYGEEEKEIVITRNEEE